MSELSSIKNQALTERVEERLFAYILDNHLKVGAKLPNEHELAAHFEVSRGTVREAVKLLVSRGVLRVKHGSGTYVASLFPLHASSIMAPARSDWRSAVCTLRFCSISGVMNKSSSSPCSICARTDFRSAEDCRLFKQAAVTPLF